MMKVIKSKKIFLIIFTVLLIAITSFCIAINKKGNVFYNLVHKQEKLADDEIELDNWEISTVFYDSTVNEGKTPLTEINWDASDGGYGTGETRTITVQITYKNTNTANDYPKNSLEITVPNLMYDYQSMKMNAQTIVGANDSSHTGYDWNFKPQNNSYGYGPSNLLKRFIFTNDKEIEKNTNLEGTIQIMYKMTPCELRDGSSYSVPRHLDESVVNFQKSISSVLKYNNASIESNEINFNYARTYIHPWHKTPIPFSEKASKINGYDGLPSGAKDYIWVKYDYNCEGRGSSYSSVNGIVYYSTYPEVAMSAMTAEVQTTFPDDVVVYGAKTKEKLYPDEETGKYKIDYTETISNQTRSILVGYPIDTYNAENGNMTQTNYATYHGYWLDEPDKLVYHDDASVTINLEYYKLAPFGNLYSTSKEKSGNKMRYKAITRKYTDSDDNLATFILHSDAIYTGEKMDITAGDDLLIATNKAGETIELSEDDYYIEKVSPFSTIRNINNEYYTNAMGKKADVYVRYQNEEEYTKLKTIDIPCNAIIDLTKESNKKVVAVYFVAKDIDQSFYSYSWIYVRIVKDDIPKEGKLYNYSYLDIKYSDDDTNEVQNQVTIDNYQRLPNKELVINNDTNKYNRYLQRGWAFNEWDDSEITIPSTYIIINKSASYTQNEDLESFTGTYFLREELQTSAKIDRKYLNDYPDKYFVHGLVAYDLLPRGMHITSSAEDIEESITHEFIWESQYKIAVLDKDRNIIDKELAFEIIKNGVDVEVTKNYKNTGRDRVKIVADFKDNPLMFFTESSIASIRLNWKVNYELSYDNFLEYGKTYTNYLYTDKYEEDSELQFTVSNSNVSTVTDRGVYDKEYVDINENGLTNDQLGYTKTQMTINSIISTNQDIQTSVQTDNNEFNTKKAVTLNESEYKYKLRARTGASDVTNLVIYDSLEDYAKNPDLEMVKAAGLRHYWQGEFLGVDTTFAESKGYTIKVYYNENPLPGTLKDDNGWKVYSDSVDKTKVKSLAFEYLNAEGTAPAVLPANSLTYVLVKMQAPTEEYKTFTYNGCWTEWNAIDPMTDQPVDFVTGINSNIVRVALPSSVEPEDIELTLTKKWQDNSNSLNKRPENVTFRIIPNDDYSKATDVTFSGTGNTWTYNVTVPKYDDDGEEIEYTIKEDTINLEDNYKYVPSVDNYEVTNTLYKNIVITKNWLDNDNSYLTRPPNITVKVYQNGNYYKDLNITGDYSTNTWTGSLSVPVFDNSGNEYTYTVDEISVDNYNTTCENLVCTNLLTGNDKITITKEWIDNDNSYNTRPSSITVKLKQNGTDYRTISLTGDSNTWESDEITVPIYDNNGVKYIYTIEETPIEHYGLVAYDQENFKITNTLKETTLLTITKKWLDKDNEYNTRPDNLEITLLQNDSEYQTLTLSGDTDRWRTTIEVPKYDDNQQEYTYSIKEVNDNLEDYQDITYSDDELSVTNKLQKNVNLKVTKNWIDHNNEYKTRPSRITVKLLQDGEEYQDLELSGDGNIWETSIEVPVYDNDSNKHVYTIMELDPIDNYKKITYDQTTYTITNELTDIPKVTLYFTVLNGYVEPGTSEIKYDEEGFREILKRHNINPDSDYEFTFELQNIETNKIYEGKLSTKGILEFEDIPYGDYRALEGKDDIFEFVSMESIGEVLGVKFTPGKNGGIISIRPTGQDIIYGANIINKVSAPMKNPNTSSKTILLVTSIILLVVSLITVLLMSKRISKRFILPTIKIF